MLLTKARCKAQQRQLHQRVSVCRRWEALPLSRFRGEPESMETLGCVAHFHPVSCLLLLQLAGSLYRLVEWSYMSFVAAALTVTTCR